MILTLEATGPQAAALAGGGRREFSAAGGVIGRAKGTDWTLPNSKVSGRHAVISYLDGVFYLEDTSTNGVFINSPKNRLVSGRRYALQSGDRIFIEPYEIEVTVSSDAVQPAAGRPGAADPFDLLDPFGVAPPLIPPQRGAVPIDEPSPPGISQILDPLILLGSEKKPAVVRKAQTAEGLDQSPMRENFRPPAAVAPPNLQSRREPFAIPADYDPLRDDFNELPPPPPVTPTPPREITDPRPSPIAEIPEPFTPVPPPAALPVPVPFTPPVAPVNAPESGVEPPFGLAALMTGAGLENVPATPELARTFGRIFRVVVAGVMDVLRSRQQIKDEFRMHMTQFRPTDNNPLKFSANVDDALHNLLVKRNAAYLEPVEAFKDAFDDLRNHQLAMLAGMRVAFDSMLAEFHPDRLEMQFDGPVKRRSMFRRLAGVRYWQLYRARRDEMDKDPEARFRDLFGEEFARAYEEQLNLLKAASRGRAAGEDPAGPSST